MDGGGGSRNAVSLWTNSIDFVYKLIKISQNLVELIYGRPLGNQGYVTVNLLVLDFLFCVILSVRHWINKAFKMNNIFCTHLSHFLVLLV